jgi:hypothetical protein
MAARQIANERQELYTDDPVINVLSRILAWEAEVRGHSADEITRMGQLVREVRHALGISISQEYYTKEWYENNQKNIKQQVLRKGTPATNWRFLNLPSHLVVRTLASDPVISQVDTTTHEKLISFKIVFGDPVIPSLKICIGVGLPPNNDEQIEKRAIYLLLHDEKKVRKEKERLYIGKADIVSERIPQHLKGKQPHYYFMALPFETEPQFNGDVRDATEALMIAFWSEVAAVSNNNFGTTVKPISKSDFHMSILLTTAISAAYVFTVQNEEISKKVSEGLALGNNKVKIPFLMQSGSKYKEWPDCYTNYKSTISLMDELSTKVVEKENQKSSTA